MPYVVTFQHPATTNPITSGQGSTAVATSHRDLAWKILSTHGSALTASLIHVISSDAPGYAVDARQGSAGSLLWSLRFLCQDLVQQWVGEVFQVCRRRRRLFTQNISVKESQKNNVVKGTPFEAYLHEN